MWGPKALSAGDSNTLCETAVQLEGCQQHLLAQCLGLTVLPTHLSELCHFMALQ